MEGSYLFKNIITSFKWLLYMMKILIVHLYYECLSHDFSKKATIFVKEDVF